MGTRIGKVLINQLTVEVGFGAGNFTGAETNQADAVAEVILTVCYFGWLPVAPISLEHEAISSDKSQTATSVS